MSLINISSQISDQPNARLVARSLASVWHPCTQMKQHADFPLIPIQSGDGVWLTDMAGKRYLDGVSSWWVNLFGHANPRINAALVAQLNSLEHVMLAGCTHEPAVELAERLAGLTGLGHAFYASDGASAVEIALKMSFHYWRNVGQPFKQKFVALSNSYHGETLGALAVTDVALFRDVYHGLLNNNIITPAPVPSVHQLDDNFPCCIACAEEAAQVLEQLLMQRHHEIAAFIVEPLVQGAAGMRMYHPHYLVRARQLCTAYNVHLIADEIMTGFGRTGTMFAWTQSHAPRPDFICLSKGITGGYLPLSCVLTTDTVYAAFYDDATARGFLHSHSYTGSALACRAALATLDIFESDNVIALNAKNAPLFNQYCLPLREHPRVKNFRHLGMIWAFELETRRTAFAQYFFAEAVARGLLLRPIGYTVYFMPPYVIDAETFKWMVDQTLAILDNINE